MVWNTPTSELVALIVPVNPARTRIAKLSVRANAMPPTTIKTAIVEIVRRRPYRSANRDHPTVMTADPAIAAVSTMPIRVGSRPSRSR